MFREPILYTADDEEPNCLERNFAGTDDEIACKFCGPEYWWRNYCRTEIVTIGKEDDKK